MSYFFTALQHCLKFELRILKALGCKQIIAGLRKHVSKEDLLGKRVAVVANLKAAKLAGETSEGMILAAVCKGEQYDHGELVKPLHPPGLMQASRANSHSSKLRVCSQPKWLFAKQNRAILLGCSLVQLSPGSSCIGIKLDMTSL